MAAGSLADHGEPIIPGIVGGAAAAVLGFYAARSLFSRVRKRLDPDAQGALPIYSEGAARARGRRCRSCSRRWRSSSSAALVWLLAGGRRRAGEKYAGLRILR